MVRSMYGGIAVLASRTDAASKFALPGRGGQGRSPMTLGAWVAFVAPKMSVSVNDACFLGGGSWGLAFESRISRMHLAQAPVRGSNKL